MSWVRPLRLAGLSCQGPVLAVWPSPPCSSLPPHRLLGAPGDARTMLCTWGSRGQGAQQLVGWELLHRPGNGTSLWLCLVTSLPEAFRASDATPVGQDPWIGVYGWGGRGIWMRDGDRVRGQQHYCRWFRAGSDDRRNILLSL